MVIGIVHNDIAFKDIEIGKVYLLHFMRDRLGPLVYRLKGLRMTLNLVDISVLSL